MLLLAIWQKNLCCFLIWTKNFFHAKKFAQSFSSFVFIFFQNSASTIYSVCLVIFY
ncbi:predicted protein [Enterococcus faecalis ATCC 4200]|nr:predicted protein [Enterococcus faecalis ATCC 4200]